MAVNEVYLQGDTISMPLPAGASAVASGDPIMFGTGTSPGYGLSGVCETSYTPPTGVATGNVAVRFKGVFSIAVLGKDAVGGSNKAFAPGDKCYYSGGTYDATTGARYGGVLTNDAVNGAYFGNVLDIVAAGATTTVRVRLKVAG